MNNSKFKWLPLFVTNFLGVMNDNFLKNLICFIAVLWLGNQEDKSLIIMAASGLMVLPFIFFSPIAGKLAREQKKARIIQLAKIVEIPIMLLAALGFIFESVAIVMVAMFLMGFQSCMYSPAKYGIIKEIGGKEGISFGTGAMEMLTFTAVLIGTFVAGLVSDIHLNETFGKYQLHILTFLLLFLSITGWLSSIKIKAKEHSAPDEEHTTSINPITFFIDSYKFSKSIKGLNFAILGLATFWLVAAMIQMNLIVYCPEYLNMTNTETSFLMALVAIGIGAGCYLAGVISQRKVKTSLIPVGGVGMIICLLLISVLEPSRLLFSVLIITTAFFAGLFKIPLNAYIQDQVKGNRLGQVLAYNNTVLFFFILVSSGIFGLVEQLFNSGAVFIVITILTVAITIISYITIPGTKQKFLNE